MFTHCIRSFIHFIACILLCASFFSFLLVICGCKNDFNRSHSSEYFKFSSNGRKGEVNFSGCILFFLLSSFFLSVALVSSPSVSPSAFDSQFIQTRQVAQSLWEWSLASSQMGSFQPPALSAHGVLIPSRGTLSLPDWISRERQTPGPLHTITAQSGSRWGGNLSGKMSLLVKKEKEKKASRCCRVWLFSLFLHQVDLEKTKRLTGIITQGAKDFGVVQFVSLFKVAYSNDGESWSTVKEDNTTNDKVRYTVCESLKCISLIQFNTVYVCLCKLVSFQWRTFYKGF